MNCESQKFLIVYKDQNEKRTRLKVIYLNEAFIKRSHPEFKAHKINIWIPRSAPKLLASRIHWLVAPRGNDWLCAAAREGTGGPEENWSQRAEQLGTSCPSDHPAARLNLWFCSAAKLKEAARRANSSEAWHDLIFLRLLVGGNWGVEGLIGLRLHSEVEDHRGRWVRDKCATKRKE